MVHLGHMGPGSTKVTQFHLWNVLIPVKYIRSKSASFLVYYYPSRPAIMCIQPRADLPLLHGSHAIPGLQSEVQPTNDVWIYLWCVSSWSDSVELLVRQVENSTSGQGSFRERSPVGSPFSELLFLDVPGTATEQVQTSGFRRNSSSLDKAPKMRDSVQLNSWENFLVTLPSISSETWAMYSSAIPGLSVFSDWSFLVFSGVFLETAANFLLFLNVAIILRVKLVSCETELMLSFIFFNRSLISFFMREKVSINANS